MGAIVANKLSFEIADVDNCKLLPILDTSEYTSDIVELPTLQVLIPGYNEDDVVELSYYPSKITLLNSNVLGITHVANSKYYQALPDGLWTIKMSICPFEDNWYEKKFYRTCELECKYYQAFLKLELDKCETCYNKQKAEKLNTAWIYLQGVKANVGACNFKQATDLYNISSKILDDIINCEC